jgi:hypothetical protein
VQLLSHPSTVIHSHLSYDGAFPHAKPVAKTKQLQA